MADWEDAGRREESGIPLDEKRDAGEALAESRLKEMGSRRVVDKRSGGLEAAWLPLL